MRVSRSSLRFDADQRPKANSPHTLYMDKGNNLAAADVVNPFTITALNRRNRQPRFLDQGRTDESADRMRLPASGLHDLFDCRSFRLPKQFDDGRLLTVRPGHRRADT